MVDPTGHFSIFNLVMNIVCVVVDIAIIASVVATGGATLPLAVGATFGLVSGVLGIASESLTIYDEKNGTDHSDTIGRLGLASGVFGVASIVGGIGGGARLGTNNSAKAFGKKSTKAFKNADDGIKSKVSKAGTRKRNGRERLDLTNERHRGNYCKAQQNAAIAADQRSLLRKGPLKSAILTATGADISSVSKILNSQMSVASRSGYGIWAGLQFVANLMSIKFLVETDWTPGGEDDDEPSGSGNSIYNKYPIQ